MFQRKNKNKNYLLIGSSLILLTSLIIFSYYNLKDYVDKKQEEKKIEEFIQTEINTNIEIKEETKEEIKKEKKDNKIDYLAVIEIPKINLKKGLYNIDSINNNVNRNIEVLKESNMPDYINGNFILASHSGYGSIAYFHNLNKLSVNDEVYIYYSGKKYIYKVSDIYEIDKTGKASIKRDMSRSTLTMFTCKGNTDKQIVVISYLVN